MAGKSIVFQNNCKNITVEIHMQFPNKPDVLQHAQRLPRHLCRETFTIVPPRRILNCMCESVVLHLLFLKDSLQK